jgi:hypothetical protein
MTMSNQTPVDVTPRPLPPRTYLGDGLFAEFDGYQFKLAASDGIRDTDTVYLELSVLKSFLRFAKAAGVNLQESI